MNRLLLQLFNRFLPQYKAALFDVAIKNALEGNKTMLRLSFERTLPPKSATEEPVNLTVAADMLNLESLFAFDDEI